MHWRRLTAAMIGLGALLALAAGCPRQDSRSDTTSVSATAQPVVADGPAEWAARWPAPEGEVKALACDKSETVLRPLDDPDNPYRGRYSEIDYWALAHVNPDEAMLMKFWTGNPPPDYQVINAVVDRDGFLVPYLEIYRLNIVMTHQPAGGEFQRADYTYLDVDSVLVHPDSNKCMRSFPAGGTIPPDLRADFETGICRYLAPYIPTVPGWLADEPPLIALLMKDGEIVTYGEPGSDNGGLLSVHEAEQAATEPWLRYSRAGELLERAEPPRTWIDFYFPGFQALQEEMSTRGGRVQVEGGLVLVTTPGADVSQAVYNYRGEQFDPDQYDTAPPPPYEELPGRLLKYLADAQQAAAETNKTDAPGPEI